MKLNALNLGLAAGILWAAVMFVMTLISAGTGYSGEFLKMMSGIYPGYRVSVAGSIIGLIYGFVDGFVGLYLFGKLYNWLTR
ncbi:MAG: bacteriophage holin [Candidatus Tectomicrobia bacterium]|nr:bacteriophage holin [Candidatus Tectomicrobia bacterium]